MKSKKLFLTFKSWLAPNSILFLYPVWSLFLRAISNFKAGKKKEKKVLLDCKKKLGSQLALLDFKYLQ
jgi:hypothetical protein